MRELGINVEETAIMSAIIPVVGIIMPPVSGIIADRIGNFKVNFIQAKVITEILKRII
jgi:nitrate/nitrite transporter NarK